MTAAEKRHLARVASLGCYVCGRPAEIHHLRSVCGMSQRASNYQVIGLCPYHHRQGPFGDAIHNGQKTFEDAYGTEAEMLDKTLKRLGVIK